MFASIKDHSDVVRILLSRKAKVSIAADDGATPLHLSASNGHLAVTVALVEAGAELDAKTIDGSTPLHVAAEGGHLGVCLLYTSPSPRDRTRSRMPSSA